MNVNQLIEKLTSFQGNWLRVNDELCIHCFVDEFYVVLCRYNRGDGNTIRVDVDDIEKENFDIIKEDYIEGSEQYSLLLPIYENAKSIAQPAYRNAGAA